MNYTFYLALLLSLLTACTPQQQADGEIDSSISQLNLESATYDGMEELSIPKLEQQLHEITNEIDKLQTELATEQDANTRELINQNINELQVYKTKIDVILDRTR